MSLASTTKQRHVPGGKIFIDLFDAVGNKTGELYIGLTPGFTLSIKSDSIQSYSTENGIRELDDETVISITRTGKLTCRQISQETLALFLAAEASVYAQAAATVTDEALHVRKDRHYQLGATVANPTGVRNISAVTVTGLTAGEYTVDLAGGRMYVHADAAIVDAGVDITVDYTAPAETRDRLATGQRTAMTGSLRFEANNIKGIPRDLYGPNVNFAPSGDLVLKADDPKYNELSWDISFSTGRNGEPALIIDGRAE
ncbi:MAG: hypothetical protein WAT67_09450 [Candidatus Contendobacter sp.]